jgi:cytochrome c551/c552
MVRAREQEAARRPRHSVAFGFVPGRRNKPKPAVGVGEVLLWLLFTILLVPAGAVGWAIGHYTGHHGGGGTRTVTVSAPATTTASKPTTTTAATTTAAAKPTVDAKAIFTSAGCGACHTFTPAGTSGTIGPNLDTAPEKDAKATNMPLAAFVKESIVKPSAYLSPGYKDLMPKTFGSSLSAAKIDALVNYIVTKK